MEYEIGTVVQLVGLRASLYEFETLYWEIHHSVSYQSKNQVRLKLPCKTRLKDYCVTYGPAGPYPTFDKKHIRLVSPLEILALQAIDD